MLVALLHTRLRVEERLLLDAFDTLGVRVDPIDISNVVFDVAEGAAWRRYDVVLDRSVSLTASLTAIRVLEGFGIRCINCASAVEICSDKLTTSIALARASIAAPGVRVALEAGAAVEAVEQIGYPAVIKPTVGSWGRLVARVNDRDAAESIIDHRATLGSTQQRVFYVQEHIEKPGRDLRVFVVGGEPVAAIARTSAHWVTNTARGARASGVPITPELENLSRRAATCSGADITAVDLLECPERGLLVNELNHSMEFRNSIETTGIDIPGRIAEHAIHIAESVRAEAAGAPA